MRVHRLTATALATAVSVAVAVGAGPAMAESHTTDDSRHDVVRLSDDAATGPGTLAPHHRAGDVTSMRAAYDPQRVRVTVHYASLVPPGNRKELTLHLLTLRTNEGLNASLSLVPDRRHPQGQRFFESGARDQRCRGVHTRISYRNDEVRYSIPRGCLSDPRWVSVGAGAAIGRGQRLYADDVSRNGRVGEEIVLGPRLHRG